MPDSELETFISPLGLALAVLFGVLLLVLPRRYASFPIFMAMSYLTLGNRFVIGGLNFTMMRVLLLFLLARILLRGEIRRLKLNGVDAFIIALVISGLVTYTLLFGTFAALKYKLGMAYNVTGYYFLFRCLIRGREDVLPALRGAALAIVPLAGIMLVEKVTGHNPFAYLGGVPAFSQVRNGLVRCQGPFAHPILAGTFGATLLPLLAGLYLQRVAADRKRAIVGGVAACVIIVCAGSSGPLLAAAAGMAGLLAWRFRNHLGQMRWGIAISLVALHLVMKAPVWFLIARISLFGGSDGWHRAHLIDMTVSHFSEWWMLGIKSVASWDPIYTCAWDITNQYIVYAVDGGLITMCAFFGVVICGFRDVGRAARQLSRDHQTEALLIWALGAALFAHAVNFLSVSYFDQNVTNWYLLLAMISGTTSAVLATSRQTKAAVVAPLEAVSARPAVEGEFVIVHGSRRLNAARRPNGNRNPLELQS